jgi:indole-3-glycerol phosphate synthase
MSNLLNRIVEQKKIEIAHLQSYYSNINLLENRPEKPNPKCFKLALLKNELSFIGEIKRRSPSKGQLATIQDPLVLLKKYLIGSIDAVSVLTDTHFFGGSLLDLNTISNHLKNTSVPVLRKDFILDEIQILESLLQGADAILLIVSILKEKTKPLLNYAKQLGLDAIVEIHHESELDFALDAGAEIIGINNRNLETFEENIAQSLSLASKIPQNILKISESGIKTPDDICLIHHAGFNGVLIGESLVRSPDPTALLKTLRGNL